MLIAVRCTSCGKEGSFPIQLKLQYEMKSCDQCHHINENAWDFHFCNSECMFEWFRKNKVEEIGVPCRSCYNMMSNEITGFAFGFKENGICKVCDGTKQVKVRHTN